ncbi:hypothetical protein M885DRAFT_551896 [Pelagophyceae sp. CCMP2097]|nr:hypothetical protein M885DRAFT_551896 [Pelagophyceae sp. CCMP2097]
MPSSSGGASQVSQQRGVCGHVVVRLDPALAPAADDSPVAVVCVYAGARFDVGGPAARVRIPIQKDAVLGALTLAARDPAKPRVDLAAATAPDLAPLLCGAVEQVAVSLENGGRRLCGVVLEYRAHGLSPLPGDAVEMEHFAAMRDGDVDRGVLPRRETPLVVEKVDREARWITVGWDHAIADDSGESWRCSVRVHRNTLFVVHRSSWADRLIYEPANAVLATEFVLGVAAVARPALFSAHILLTPVVVTSKIALSSLGAIAGAVLDPILGTRDPNQAP